MSTRIDSNRPVVPAAQPAPAPAAKKNEAISGRHEPAKMDGFKTGTGHNDGPVLSPAQDDAITARANAILAGGTARPEKVIDVHFHVVRKGTGVANGDVTEEQIAKQIQVLNDAYKGSGFSFRLASTDRTTNAKWFTAQPDSSAEKQMKSKLHKGDSDDLNVYTTNPGQGLLGWATFPNEYKKSPLQDGVVLLHSSLPGGSMKPFNEGDTGTHEVGHWMGLFHTWNEDRGGPRPEGDQVADTPAHAEPNSGKAPVTTDTLPKEPGFDPVKNFMNYTDDDWMDHFTDGQRARMAAQFDLFRAVKPKVSAAA